MLPIAATLVRQGMERRRDIRGPRIEPRGEVVQQRMEPAPENVDRARRAFEAEVARVRARVRELEAAIALIERATEDGLRAASDDGERAETFRASALHARRLAAA